MIRLKWSLKDQQKLLVLLVLLLLPQLINAQTNTEIYGQNRVQYRTFKWKYFDTKHFRVYHYDRTGIPLARYVAEQAERDIPLIERRLGGDFPDRFNIILYNNYDEVRQTNIGLKFESQLQDVSAGTFDLVGDKLLIYFNGVHTDLQRQIRLGIVRVMMQRLIFGQDAKSIAKNAITQTLPKWTTEGYVSYIVDGWDPKTESEWKNVLDAQPKAGFFKLGDEYPELAGKAFWKYISDRYGEERVPTVLSTMNQRSNINKGVKDALGMKIKPTYDSCMAYYKTAFAKDALVQENPDSANALINIKVPNDGSVIRSMRISPRGRDIAYCEFKEGEYKIYIQHTGKEQQRSLILSTGKKDFNDLTPDANYPLLAWSNNGYKVAILYRYKRQTRIRIYNSLKAKIENYIVPPNRFDRVTGMTFNETDEKLIFSAIKKSQTDLYLFTLKRSVMTNITDDIWDDVQPWTVSGGGRKGLLFLSNRPQANLNVPAEINELPTGPMNMFYYDFKTESTVLMKCSDNKSNNNISQPIQYGDYNFAYLLDSNGINNKYVVVFGRDVNNMDSAISVPVTNYSRSILSHQFNLASNQVADVLQVGDQYKVFFSPMMVPGVNVQAKVLQRTTLASTSNIGNYVPPSSKARTKMINMDAMPEKTEPIIKSGNIFHSEFTDTATTNQSSTPTTETESSITNQMAQAAIADTNLLDPNIKDSTYLKLKSKPYRLSFKPDFLGLRLDNTVLFTKYQPAGYNGNQFANPPLGGLITASLNDALENHRFTGGIRLPTPPRGMTWFLQYQNFTKRADWGLVFLRSSQRNEYNVRYTDSSGTRYFDNPQTGKVVTSLIQGSYSYPFSRVDRLGLQLGFRQDKLNFLAQDSLSLIYTPPAKTYWVTSRAEYVYDNTRAPIQNIRFGFRYKFFGEYFYGLSKENKGGMYNLGIDFRYYKQIFRNSIFAARFAGAHSAGDQKILYLVGGVDNQIGAPQGGGAPTNPEEKYAFQAQATNLRGYKQNARAGNTYAVGNFELRIPVLNTVLQRPVRSNFLRSIQLIGFLDAGSAWDGLLPNANERTYTFSNPNGTVITQLSRDLGFAMGYGAGTRATLFGYFIRVDAAWNIDRLQSKPLWYFSIGTDF